MLWLTWQTMLLLALAYLAGCCVSCFIRRMFGRASAPVMDTAPADAMAPATVPVPRATSEFQPQPITIERGPVAAPASAPVREAFRRADTLEPVPAAAAPAKPAATGTAAAPAPASAPPPLPSKPQTAVPVTGPTPQARFQAALEREHSAASAASARSPQDAAPRPESPRVMPVSQEEPAGFSAVPAAAAVASAAAAAAAVAAAAGRQAPPPPQTESPPHPTVRVPAPSTPLPAPAAAPPAIPAKPATTDDLKRIRAIDAGLEAALNRNGIHLYSQIAAWKPEDVAQVSRTLGFKGRIEQENWIEQAQILARGEETYYSRRIASGAPTNAAPASSPAMGDGAPRGGGSVPAVAEQRTRPGIDSAAAAAAALAAASASRTTVTAAPRAGPSSPPAAGAPSAPAVSEKAAFGNQPRAVEVPRAAAPVVIAAQAAPRPGAAATPGAPVAAPAATPSAAVTPAAPLRAPAAPSQAPVAGAGPALLQRIAGIDAEVEKLLLAQGVRGYQQIAGWSPADVERFDRLFGQPGRIVREAWVEQAQLLARGGSTPHSRELDRQRAAVAAALAGAPAAPKPPVQATPPNQGAQPTRSAPPTVTAPDAPRPSSPPPPAPSAPAPSQVQRPHPVVTVAPRPPAVTPSQSVPATRGADGGPSAAPVPSTVPVIPSASSAPAPSREPASPPPPTAANNLSGLRSVRSEAFQGQGPSGVPQAARASRSSEPDDLKRIRGIGVLIEKKLNSIGVTTYEQIANWSGADIDRVSEMLDFKGRIERENWVEQARILAAGGQTEFSRRADRGEWGGSGD